MIETVRFRGKTESCYVHPLGAPRFSEIDAYGVVWNGHYVNYFEVARLALCRKLGFDLGRLAELGVYLPVHRFELSLRKPVLPHEEMRVAVRPTRLTESVMEFRHRLLVGSETRAIGDVRHVAMGRESGQMLYELPPAVADILRPLKEAFD